jgi:hypothetical protein
MSLTNNTRKRGRSHMLRHLRTVTRSLPAALVAVFVLGSPAGASAHSGMWAAFNYCPVAIPEAHKCQNTDIYGGIATVGKKTVPIVNPVTFQSGYTLTEKDLGISHRRFSYGVPATNGVTLSKTPEPVPGGLLGLLPPSSSPPAVRQLSAYYVEHNLTAVNSTVELAEPPNEIIIDENTLLTEEGLATQMKVKLHLENPFLGSSCYIGSNSSPLIWNLTTGRTAGLWEDSFNNEPWEARSIPLPNRPIAGTSGSAFITEETYIAGLTGAEVVDNGWSAPAATGCGGALAPLVDPIIDAATGLPAPAGENTIRLKFNLSIATSVAVRSH